MRIAQSKKLRRYILNDKHWPLYVNVMIFSDGKAQITGHTEWMGSFEYKKACAQRRELLRYLRTLNKHWTEKTVKTIKLTGI